MQQAADGKLDPALKHESVLLLSGTLGAAPQISHVALWQPDGREITLYRGESRRLVVETENNQDAKDLKDYLNWVRGGRKLIWNEPFRLDGTTLISVAAPLFHEGKYLGVAAAGVSVEELSALVAELGDAYDVKGFIIYGEDRLLAHAQLPELPTTTLDSDNPLHQIDVLNSPVVDGFLNSPKDFAAPSGAFDVHAIQVEDSEYLALSREITGFGNTAWTIGAYSPRGDWDTQIKRLNRSIFGGLALLVMAVIAAVFLSRKVAKPIRETAAATLKIGNLDLDKIKPLPAPGLQNSTIRQARSIKCWMVYAGLKPMCQDNWFVG